MDAQARIDHLKERFFHVLTGDHKPYFMLSKPRGNGTTQIINQEGSNLNDMWESVERAVWSEYHNGVRKFILTMRKGGAKGSAFEAELDLGFGLISGGDINGIPGQPAAQPTAYNTDYINAITGLVKMQSEFDAFKENMKLEKLLEQKDAQIAALAYDQRSTFEKVADAIGIIAEKIEGMGGFQGLAQFIATMKSQQPIPATIAGTKTSKQKIKEQTAPPDAEVPEIGGTKEQAEARPIDDDDDTEFQKQYDLACDGVDLMMNAGIGLAGEKLLKVARYVVENPEQASNIIKMLE